MRPVPTSSIIVRDRVRRDLGDIEALARSIEKHGQIQPIVVLPDRTLIAGERRLRACELLKRDVKITFLALDGDEELLGAERDENTQRKPLTHDERVYVYQRMLEIEQVAAAKRRAEGAAKGGRAKRDDASSGADDPQVEEKGKPKAKRAADRAAAAAGFGNRREAERAAAVVDAARDNEELRPLVDKLNKTGKA